MENIDPERLRYKRGPGRPKQAEVMPQISIRIPQWMLDNQKGAQNGRKTAK